MSVTLHHGDCLKLMAAMPEASVDAIVTDPPYGLGFMGKAWDDLPPGQGWAEACLRVLKPGGYLLAFGGTRTWHRLACAIEDAGLEIRDSIAWLHGQGFPKGKAALKPAHEPIVVARRKPDAPRTGLLQIDACRVGVADGFGGGRNGSSGFVEGYAKGEGFIAATAGRWPANVVLDETTAAVLDEQSGQQKDGAAGGKRGFASSYVGGKDHPYETETPVGYGGGGGASRFFYVAKAPTKERPKVNDIAHPTVKPLTLMRWLVRLVTPPGGTVLDPFTGSGTTIEACILEGFDCIGIEREADYLPLIEARMARHPVTLFA